MFFFVQILSFERLYLDAIMKSVSELNLNYSVALFCPTGCACIAKNIIRSLIDDNADDNCAHFICVDEDYSISGNHSVVPISNGGGYVYRDLGFLSSG
jgi:hypothetical protein